jgi:predicted transcriptional regulator
MTRRTTFDLSRDQSQLLLECVEEQLYKVALEMEEFKGGPMTAARKKLDKRQKSLEELQHQIMLGITS